MTATETARVLHRSPEWVTAHASELGGYQDAPGRRWRFNARGIARFQERQAAAWARRVIKFANDLDDEIRRLS